MPIRKYDCIIVHTGEKDISFHFPNERYVYNDLHDAFHDQSKCTMEIKSRRKPRNLPQNAYLHLCLQMIADETGNDLEVVKTTVKAMYAKKPLLDKEGEPIYDKNTGEQAMYIQDTRDMSSVEFMNFTTQVHLFAQEFLNMRLPLPNETI